MVATLRSIADKALQAVRLLPVQPEIRILSGRCGLFSDVFMALNSIQKCEKYNLSGHIHWGRRSLYFDQRLAGNAYEYFFKTSGFSFSNNYVLKRIPFLYVPPGDDYPMPVGRNPRRHFKQLIDAFATPRGDVIRRVDNFRRTRLQAKSVVGIHVRRTDVLTNSEGRRAQPISNFVESAERWLTENNDGLIFLATDDSKVVMEFYARFGDRVRFQDATRSSDGTSIHGHYDAGIDVSAYKKGLEALTDALILSQCSFLIRCFSFLTNYSLCNNPDLKFLDLDKQNLGVVRTPWIHK